MLLNKLYISIERNVSPRCSTVDYKSSDCSCVGIKGVPDGNKN